MDKTSYRIVDFAISARDASFSASAVDACKRSLVDTFACALGAFDTPLAHKARHTAGRYKGGQPAAQVWGCDWTASVEMAAYANGVMLRLLDLSDAYRKKCGGHPSDVVAAIAAAADACNSSGAEVIAATIAAYEIYCACCDAVDLNALGWDQPVYGVVASAMGAGMLFGLGREQMGQALSLALAPNLALLQTRRGSLSNWKNCAGANAARNGMFAVLLAREGYTGPEEVFEGPHGLFEITGAFDWDLPSIAGESNRIARVNFKNFPLCYHGQAAAWAAKRLFGVVRPDQIESIDVATYQQSFNEMASESLKWAPRTAETADHSLPFVVATMLVYGDVDMDSFNDARLDDAVLAGLMRKTRVTVDPALSDGYPQSAPCRLSVRLASGDRFDVRIDSAKGHADNPMGFGDLRTKFGKLTAGRCEANRVADFCRAIGALEHAPCFRETVGTWRHLESTIY